MGLHVPRQLVLDRETLLATVHGTRQVPSVDVPLNVFLQQHLLVEGATAHRALVPELVVHLPVLFEVDATQELLLALAAGKGKVRAVLLQVLLQLALVLECSVRAVGAGEQRQPRVRAEVHVQLTDLGEQQGTLVAGVLLHLVMRLHVVVEVRNLGKGPATVVLDADKGALARVQAPVVVQVRDLQEGRGEGELVSREGAIPSPARSLE